MEDQPVEIGPEWSLFRNNEKGIYHTLGLYKSWRIPELVLSAPIDTETAGDVLFSAYDLMRQSGFIPGQEYHHVLQDYTIRIQEVSQEAFQWSMRPAFMYYGCVVPALQILLPDQNNLFPGEEGYAWFTQRLPEDETSFLAFDPLTKTDSRPVLWHRGQAAC